MCCLFFIAVEVSSGSEEEEVITLDEDDLDCKVVPK